MFENLSKLLKILETANPTLKKDAVAVLLKTSPETLAAFEEAYSKRPITSDGGMNSRQAVDMRHAECGPALEQSNEAVDTIIKRVVDELLAQTSVYVFDGNLGKTEQKLLALPAGTQMVCQEDVSMLPVELRPQLTGELMSVDIAEPSYQSLLFFWNEYMTEKNPKRRKIAYNQFRQGLDILDLDPITYLNRRKTPAFRPGDTALALDSYAVLETWRAPCGHKAADGFVKIHLPHIAYNI